MEYDTGPDFGGPDDFGDDDVFFRLHNPYVGAEDDLLLAPDPKTKDMKIWVERSIAEMEQTDYLLEGYDRKLNRIRRGTISPVEDGVDRLLRRIGVVTTIGFTARVAWQKWQSRKR